VPALVGRAGPEVRGVQARYLDGRVAAGDVQNGFFLILLPGSLLTSDAAMPERLEPLDGSGGVLPLSPESSTQMAPWLGGRSLP
jgi:hypothetical protein